jgi:hypothetical protein
MQAIESQLRDDMSLGCNPKWNADVNVLRERLEKMEELNVALEDGVAFLDCLQSEGVESWEGYEKAKKLYEGE